MLPLTFTNTMYLSETISRRMKTFEDTPEKSGLKFKRSVFDKYFDANLPLHDKSKSSPFRRTAAYCNAPDIQASFDEGDVPDFYRLIQVHAVIRHGDRSPMSRLPGNITNVKLDCLIEPEKFSKEIVQYVANYTNAMKELDKGEEHFMFGPYPHRKYCSKAILTGMGAVQHLISGIQLRKKYKNQHNLVPEKWNSSHFEILTTGYSRTYQSAVALLYGLIPNFNLSKITIKVAGYPAFCTRDMARLTGIGCRCGIISHLKKLSAKEVAQLNTNVTLYRGLVKELSKLAGVKVTAVTGFIDAISAYECHNISLPCYGDGERCYTKELIDKLWLLRDIKTQNDARNQFHQTSARLHVQPLLTNIFRQMKKAVTGSNLKFALYSGHDSTITLLSVSLGFGGNTHPPFASRIVFELYEKKSNSRDIFLKILYNGQDVTKLVIFCRRKTTLDGLCPMKYLQQYIEDVTFYYNKRCPMSPTQYDNL